MRRSMWMGSFVVALVALFGCNTAQPTVNRVQPNVVEKKQLEGEWYYLQTVIDTPYSAGFTFVGEQGKLEKIKWEIQEDFLIARRGYEHIAGSEPEGAGSASEQDAPIAIYRIQSHFDIRRDYNTVTGEEFNTVGENTTDRPWYQRQFMRVDWSENLVPSTDIFALSRIINGLQAEPVAYYVQDLGKNHPHQPKFEVNEATGAMNYMDIVNKLFVKPDSVYIDGFGSVPSCYLLYQSHLDCASAEVTVRNSFLKVDDSRDYQPFEYTGDRMEKFGYFVTERAGYNKDYGIVDAARYRFANRHNIWQTSHATTTEGKLIGCTADDQCGSGGAGSKCDIDYGKTHRLTTDDGKLYGVCTKPYREREVRPITYYVTENFPADLWPEAQHLIDQWNGAFVGTAASLREQECLSTGGDAGSCAGERTREDGQHVFVLCHNPVVDGDPSSCGVSGTTPQIGDLRYSIIGWVNEPHLSSPLGYGPSAADPETGEIIMSNAFIYGAGLETLAAFARDLVALLNDDLSSTDISSGQYITDWIQHLKAPGSQATHQPKDDHAVRVDGSDATRINAAMDFSWARTRGQSRWGAQSVPKNLGEAFDRFDASLKELSKNGAFGDGTGAGYAKLQALAGTDIEKQLVTPEMVLAAGFKPDATKPVDESVLELASPLRAMNPAARHALEQKRNELQKNGCILMADFADDGLLGLAREVARAATEGDGTLEWYGNKYPVVGQDGKLDYELVREMLRHPIFEAVTSHEVGHTVGLRHNFSGSFDSWNYLPGYWKLRDDGNMQPRYLDAVTQTEVDGRIREYEYSTVMDYGNNFVVTDANGIGHYDHAAIKMGYGDLVEVFDGLTPQQASEVNWVNFIQSAGWPVPLKQETFYQGAKASAYKYTDYPGLVGGIDGLERRADVPYTSLQVDPSLAQQGITATLMDANGRPAVPFMFCSDETADLNPDCLRYDAGPDAYESIQSVMDSYYNYYIFSAYGRGRIGFSPGSYFNRVMGRYFGKIQSATQIYGLYRGVFEDFLSFADTSEFWTSPNGMGAWTTMVGASYQLLTQVVATPEPGAYALVTRPDGSQGYELNDFGQTAAVRVDNFEGRPLETTWDFDAGYFWFDQVDRAGFFFDKVGAIMTLVDPTTHFVGRDTSADVRKYALSYYTVFPGAMTSFLRAMQGEDWSTMAARSKEAGGLSFPDVLSQERRDTAGIPIDPNTSFSIQLYAQVFSLALIPDTYDQRFTNGARVYVKGSPNGVDLAAGTPTVEFTDAETGLVYVAASYMQDGKETGVGAQMIDHANALKVRGQTAELRKFVANLDLAHRLGWYFSFGG